MNQLGMHPRSKLWGLPTLPAGAFWQSSRTPRTPRCGSWRPDPKQAGLAAHQHKRLGSCVGEHNSGRALSEPRAVAAGDNVAHETEPITPPNCDAALGAPDANAGHERRRVLIFGGGHSFAGVNQHPLADRRLEQAARRALRFSTSLPP
jgi:hypothetical protein